LRGVTDYITLGVDSYKEKISTTQNYINPKPHIELVFLVDLKNNKFYWAGKSERRKPQNCVTTSTHYGKSQNLA